MHIHLMTCGSKIIMPRWWGSHVAHHHGCSTYSWLNHLITHHLFCWLVCHSWYYNHIHNNIIIIKNKKENLFLLLPKIGQLSTVEKFHVNLLKKWHENLDPQKNMFIWWLLIWLVMEGQFFFFFFFVIVDLHAWYFHRLMQLLELLLAQFNYLFIFLTYTNVIK